MGTGSRIGMEHRYGPAATVGIVTMALALLCKVVLLKHFICHDEDL